MKSVLWNHTEAVKSVRDRIWMYLVPTVERDDAVLDASALLQLPPADLLTLASVHFILSDEVGQLLEDLPGVVRRLPTTTAHDEEWSVERVRGAVHWPKTLNARDASGLPHVFITTPSRRAFQTPEVEMLVDVLEAIIRTGRHSRWSATSEVGALISKRADDAATWLHHRALAGVDRRRPTPRSVQRVRSGRHARRFRSTLEAFALRDSLVGRLDGGMLKDVVEQRALITRQPAVLFELMTTFDVLDALTSLGWALTPLRLFHGALTVSGDRGSDRIRVWYQQSPPGLTKGSRDAHVQHAHGMTGVVPTRPDLVLRRTTGEGVDRWFLVEVKHGLKRPVEASARAALRDLLSYRRSFDAVLDPVPEPYGLGVAWGAGLAPSPHASEILLTTPEYISEALIPFAG